MRLHEFVLFMLILRILTILSSIYEAMLFIMCSCLAWYLIERIFKKHNNP